MVNNKIIWITGAQGFLGSHLAKRLYGIGNEIFGIGHGNIARNKEAEDALKHWIVSDINQESLSTLHLLSGEPDEIFHLAGGSSVMRAIENPDEDFFKTVTGTTEILEWMKINSCNANMVVVSSAAVYGAGHLRPISETSTLSPLSPYGTHKLMMEELCAAYATKYGINIVIPRIFSIYGPELRKQLLWDLCCKAVRSGDILLSGSGEETRDWIEVSDAIELLSMIPSLASPKVPKINIASGKSLSVRHISEIVLENFQNKNRLIFSGECRPGDPKNLVANIDKLKQLKCVNLMPIEDGVKNYVNWFKNCHILSK